MNPSTLESFKRSNHVSWLQVRRLFPLLAGILIALSVFLPLWSVSMRAPQYPGEDLYIYLYAYKMGGDIFEYNRLNQYIGVRFPEAIPEFKVLPVYLALLAALSLVCAGLKGRAREGFMGALVVLFVLFLVLGASDLQWRLYRVGHDLAPNPPLKGVGTFTPPLWGPNHVGNFRTFSNFRLGGWMIGLAFLLDGIAFRRRRSTATVGELLREIRDRLRKGR